MRKLCIYLLLLIPFYVEAQIKYPETKKLDTKDDYHGTMVADPYRWLEDDNSTETKEWVIAQNELTNQYLSAIPYRDEIKKRFEELWDFQKYTAPYKHGAYYYFAKNDGLQNQYVYYRVKNLKDEPELFFDPNKLSDDGTAALSVMNFSKNAKYMAYSISQSGSDWQTGFIMDVATKEKLDDQLDWLKFTGFSWNGDEGFYYSRYPEPKKEDKLKGVNATQQVYYHKIGTSQSEDQLIYEDPEHPQRFGGAMLTDDGRFLVISTSEGTSGGEIWYKDMHDATQKDFRLLIPGFDTEPSVIDNKDGWLLVLTNDGAPNFKVVAIDPKNPGKENWKTLIPEKKEALQGVNTGGGYLFASYLKDASTRTYQYDYDGKLIRELKLPGIGSASGFGSRKTEDELFYTYSSFAFPASIFHYDMQTGKSTLFRKSEAKFDPAQYETRQVFYTSKDGTKVPMFLTYKKGLKLDGKNPVMLYSYGGFNIPMTPGFNLQNAFFMEQGGIYAQPSLRGGSEYGEDWHKGGMLENKQNVFDDFIAAAEYLVKEKYTSPEHIAIRGGSNGGLLVGAAMTQRPELFKVAIPQVGVLDMLRYHQFTIGYAWATEYGRSDNPKDFEYLYKYSPLHNLEKNTRYPATLITTADHDDRVVPAHSFKFAAALQEANNGVNPTLIRIESKAGHGAGKPTSKQIEEATDIWSFTMYNLNMPFRYKDKVIPVNAKKAF